MHNASFTVEKAFGVWHSSESRAWQHGRPHKFFQGGQRRHFA